MRVRVLGSSTVALLIGLGTFGVHPALAQNGGEARSSDRAIEKKLDERELTPIRPIRRVGEDNWPTAKDRPATTAGSPETTGQAAANPEPAKDAAKQESAKPAGTAEAKQEPAKQEAAKAEPAKQDTAKQDTAKQDVPAPDTKSEPAKAKDTAKDTAKASDQPGQKNAKGFASIRLGTDEAGRVALNEAQERQMSSALRRQRVETVDVKVSVGAAAPASARLVAVPSGMVEVLPQFRGYSYFATRENVVVVAPSTRKVVAVIPMKLTATASRTEPSRTEPQRGEPKAAARTAAAGRGIRDSDIPSREEILAAPVARGPAVVTRGSRTYGYYEPDDDDVVIVERRRPRFFRMW